MGARKFAGRAVVLVVPAIATFGVAGALGAIPASATTSVTATTSVFNHPDTTSASGGACKNGLTPGGPVWALDDYQSQVTATQTGTDTWQVAIHDSGSYYGFADPTTCAALVSTGSLIGDYALTVTSATAPTAAGLHASYDGDVSTTQMVEDFFGDVITGSDVVGGDYSFSYQGGNYVQNTNGATGDVTEVTVAACTVTVAKIADQTSVVNTAISPLQVIVTVNRKLSGVQFQARNLPEGLSIDSSTGKISGTPVRTGSQVVTVDAINTPYSSPAAPCAGTTTFSWTVTSRTIYPKGGVQTGGGKPGSSEWLTFGALVAAVGLGLSALAGFGAVVRRRQLSR